MTSSAVEPNEYRYWDLSTKHLSQEDAALLALHQSECLTVYPYAYGMYVLVLQDDVDESLDDLSEQGYSTALRELFRLANERDIRTIRFDRDGDIVKGLKQFDW